MKAPHCETAADARVALAPGAQEQMHDACPQAYLLPDGSAHACDCPCHAEETIDLAFIQRTRRLQVVHPPPADGPDRPTIGRQKVEKRPPAGRACHCGCGAAVRGSFLPGHDARLKSWLVRQANLARPNDWAEIILRRWDHLVSEAKRPHESVQLRGAAVANELRVRGGAEEWLQQRVVGRTAARETVTSA